MKTPQAIFVAAVLILGSEAAQPGANPHGPPAPQRTVHPQVNTDQGDRLLTAGKKLFVQRCARCHGERGDKPLRPEFRSASGSSCPNSWRGASRAACKILLKSSAGRCSFTSRVSSTRSRESEHRTEAQLCSSLR